MKLPSIIACGMIAAPVLSAGEPGKLSQELWINLPGFSLNDLTSSTRFYQAADVVSTVDGALSMTPSKSGARLRGYITIPADGEYQFAVAGDDAGELKMALDGNKFTAETIASFSSWTGVHNFTAKASQISVPISVTAGQRIFVEMLVKGGGGTEGIAMGWISPGRTDVVQIPAEVLESYVAAEDLNDADGNELPDHWAALPLGKDGLLDDADGDGYLNIEEAKFGTDPLVHAGVPGCLSYERWFDVGAYTIEALESLPEFRVQADTSELISAAETPVNEGTNFGARLHGSIIAPATGEYTFWISGDDHVSLYLSDTEDKFGAQKIAWNRGWTHKDNFDASVTQQSSVITLEAGKKYYICGLVKESGGGDHLSLAWRVPGGEREIIPSSALESYAYSLNDVDNDGMEDSWELANGLDVSINDALADLDGDNAPNWLEFQADSDPQAKAPVSGGLVHELWAGIEGRFVEDLITSPKFLEAPYTKSISTWSAGPFNWGSNHGNRLRGYITPVESGEYTFWVEGNKQVELLLSTNDDKFNKESLIKTVHFNAFNGFDFDYDLAQKSRTVYLDAGQAYYIEVLHKSTDKGGDHFSFAWTRPDGIREFVPASMLSTFAGQANDLDDDNLEDSWELANDLSIEDNGGINPDNGAQGDLDGDGLSNAAEQVAGTLANNIDSDGDGVSDFDEVEFLKTQALVGDVAPFVEVVSLAGAAFANPVGEWRPAGDNALHISTRGAVEYTFTLTESGVYMLDLALAPYSGSELSDDYEVVFTVDGQKLERVVTNVKEGETGNAKALTPYLKAGEHTVTVLLDNSYTYRKATLNGLKVLASAGVDVNSNGRPDWVDNRLSALNTIDGGTLASKTSPAFVEGQAQFVDLASCNWGGIQAAPGNRWFADVALDPTGATKSIGFSFENDGHLASRDFTWLATNLLHEESITIRQGASLRLTASEYAEGRVDESVSLTISGQAYSFTADQPEIVEFSQPGEYLVDLTYQSSAGSQSKQVTITVLDGFDVAEEPVVVQDYWREWSVPALPANATLELDERLIVREAIVQADGSINYTLMNTGSENLPATVRDEVTGEIISSFSVRGLRVRENGLTGITQVAVSEDGMHSIEMPVLLNGAMAGLDIHYNIFIGGVVFDDGTTQKVWSLSQLKAPVDSIIVEFKKSSTWGAVCHRGSIYQNGVRIAHMY